MKNVITYRYRFVERHNQSCYGVQLLQLYGSLITNKYSKRTFQNSTMTA